MALLLDPLDQLAATLAALPAWATWCGVGVTPATRIALFELDPEAPLVAACLDLDGVQLTAADLQGGMAVEQGVLLYLRDVLPAIATTVPLRQAALRTFADRASAVFEGLMAVHRGAVDIVTIDITAPPQIASLDRQQYLPVIETLCTLHVRRWTA